MATDCTKHKKNIQNNNNPNGCFQEIQIGLGKERRLDCVSFCECISMDGVRTVSNESIKFSKPERHIHKTIQNKTKK